MIQVGFASKTTKHLRDNLLLYDVNCLRDEGREIPGLWPARDNLQNAKEEPAERRGIASGNDVTPRYGALECATVS